LQIKLENIEKEVLESGFLLEEISQKVKLF